MHIQRRPACTTLRLPRLTVGDGGIPIDPAEGLFSTGLGGACPGYMRRPPGKPLCDIPAPVTPPGGTAWLNAGPDRLVTPALADPPKEGPDIPVTPPGGTAWLNAGPDRLVTPALADPPKEGPGILTCGPGKQPGIVCICVALGLPIGDWFIPPIGGATELVEGGKPGWCIGGRVGIVGGPGGRLVGGTICDPMGAVGAPLYCPGCNKKEKN